MFDKQHYESPPVYSPPFTSPSHNGFSAGSFHGPTSDYNAYPPPPGSYYIEDKPQHFYKWRSPPGIIKVMLATVIVLCVGIFACVASTLMWDYQYGIGGGYFGSGVGGGYGGSYGGGFGGGFGGGGGGYNPGYNNYYGSSISPYSAKSAMIAMAAINFIVALSGFIATFSKSPVIRSRKFFLGVLITSIIMGFMQGIINIVYVVGVNPAAQSSSNVMYNPMLAMCQNLYQQGYSQMGGVGGFPIYNQYLYHYCYVDPQEAVAMVCGFLVVIALAVAAFFAHKTRGKIWRYGKPNIYWEQPLIGGKASEGRDVEEWVNNVEENNSVQDAPTLLVSEKGGGHLNASVNSVISYPPAKEDSVFDTVDAYSDNNQFSDRTISRPSEAYSHERRTSSSPSEEANGVRKPSAHRGKRRRRNPDFDESQYETEYTTGGETGNELDVEEWQSMYPEIRSDAQRHEYKREFDTDLKDYKRLCADMDDINDQMNKLSRQLDSLDDTSVKYQGVAEEYNRLKDLKQTPEYQAKKKDCRRLRYKLFHIKRMVKNYDKTH